MRVPTAVRELLQCGIEPANPVLPCSYPDEADWVEVSDTYSETGTDLDAVRADVPPADADLLPGRLVVTDMGPNRLKAVAVLRRILGLSLSEALALKDADEIVATGNRRSLCRVVCDIEATGATVDFRPETTEPTLERPCGGRRTGRR